MSVEELLVYRDHPSRWHVSSRDRTVEQADECHFFAFAHLAFCAAAILARPSALIFLRGLFVVGWADPNGRPRFAGEVVLPFNRARAFSRRSISASIV